MMGSVLLLLLKIPIKSNKKWSLSAPSGGFGVHTHLKAVSMNV